MYFLGYDIGSSSVKASILNAESGLCDASAFSPKVEMKIETPHKNWAEQHPDLWWEHLKIATHELLKKTTVQKNEIKAIGISYQMHGLVLIDKNKQVLRPSIIWCDSRAVEIGDTAFNKIGNQYCLEHLLNSPGNFTASKLKWVKDYEPEIFEKTEKLLLPGDFIAMRLTGEVNSTVSGLSEGILWDFKENQPADFLMNHFGFNQSIIPETVPTFSIQGNLKAVIANELGLEAGIPVSYRAGDQPNNAMSLNVLNPGEVAATAGTSGVVYGVTKEIRYDPFSRVNTFAHVNHSAQQNRLGVLLCINGTGILNAWIKQNIGQNNLSYEQMNEVASSVKPGSEGVLVLPFGNGSERMLQNNNIGCSIHNLDFNRHTHAHLLRAGQEAVAFAFMFGMEIMQQNGLDLSKIRAGNTNMFQSPVFRETLASLSQARIELFNTDGALGAARAAGIGAGFYKNFDEAFHSLQLVKKIEPEANNQSILNAYACWRNELTNKMR